MDEPKSWTDSLNLDDIEAPPAPPRPSQEVAKPQEPHLSYDAFLDRSEKRALECRAKELEMGLYLAKAKIAELELQLLKTRPL